MTEANGKSGDSLVHLRAIKKADSTLESALKIWWSWTELN